MSNVNKSYLFLAPGFEEIEALTTVDVLRRAGISVETVSITDTTAVTGAHNITVKADTTLSQAEIDRPDWLICPGGMPGASNLVACDKLANLLRDHAARSGRIAAICAAPAVVLAQLGILDGREATCYPGFEQMAPKAIMVDRSVVVDGNIITANGPAATMPFALAIVKATLGAEVAGQIGQGLLFYPKNFEFYF